jgi:hypothetical protein
VLNLLQLRILRTGRADDLGRLLHPAGWLKICSPDAKLLVAVAVESTARVMRSDIRRGDLLFDRCILRAECGDHPATLPERCSLDNAIGSEDDREVMDRAHDFLERRRRRRAAKRHRKREEQMGALASALPDDCFRAWGLSPSMQSPTPPGYVRMRFRFYEGRSEVLRLARERIVHASATFGQVKRMLAADPACAPSKRMRFVFISPRTVPDEDAVSAWFRAGATLPVCVLWAANAFEKIKDRRRLWGCHVSGGVCVVCAGKFVVTDWACVLPCAHEWYCIDCAKKAMTCHACGEPVEGAKRLPAKLLSRICQ